MNNSTANFTTPETSTNSIIWSWTLMDSLEVFVYSINLFSFPMHCYVIWLIIGTRSGVALEFFNLNLSVCEIGICLNSLFFILSRWFSCLEILDLFLLGFSFTGRPLFQCLICVERYLAVVHPVTFLKYKPLRYRVICCSVVWIINLGSCVVCLYNAASNNYHAQAWFLTVELTLIIFIQLFCLMAVRRALKQSGPGQRGRKREVDNPMKRRAHFLILITTVTMFFLFFPFVIIGLFIIVAVDSSPTVWFTGLTCFILAGFVQPLLYLQRTGKLSFVPHKICNFQIAVD